MDHRRHCFSMRLFATTLLLGAAIAAAAIAQTKVPSPADHFGHPIGADRQLVSWDGIVEYLNLIGAASPRIIVRDLGPTTQGRPFLLVEIASADTIRDLDTFRGLQRKLYFQDHRPGQDPDSVHTAAEREEIFGRGKAVVLITCTIHSTEVGAAQMALELVYRLATEDSPRVHKILDNVIFLLVPSLNPDGQAMVADWYREGVGTPYEAGPLPWLYHPYVGHDNNRDMYAYTQAETRLIGQVLYRDWFPSIWLDEHQMGSTGARIFTMPATDPINLNVHPLIYRLNGIFGQAQSAALEAAGKTGIIYDSTYTNFWQGAMAWTGWWHNQVGLLTEVASARVATPTEQRLARLGGSPAGADDDFRQSRRRMLEHPDEPLPPPRDIQPRTNYPRPWLGGRWSLRDIVDYELIATFGLLESAADSRRLIQEQIYEVNRSTIAMFREGEAAASSRAADGYAEVPTALAADRPETGRVMAGAHAAAGHPYAIVIPADQHDPPTVARFLETLERAGVKIERARADFEAGGKGYPAGTFVIRLGQVFGRYAKDLLEPQTYPEVRRAPGLDPEPPYDVTAWSLGLQMGVETAFVAAPFEAALEPLDSGALAAGRVHGEGAVFAIDPAYNDGFRAANRLLGKAGVRVSRTTRASEFGGRKMGAGAWVIEGAERHRIEALATELGIDVAAAKRAPAVPSVRVERPRLGVYQPWGSNMDEGWTRYVLEQYEFEYTTLHPQDFRAAGRDAISPSSGAIDPADEIPAEVRARWPPHVAARAPASVVAAPLRERFDVLLFADQDGDAIVKGDDYPVIQPVYRGGIGEEGVRAVRDFLAAGGVAIALGDSSELFIERWPIPVRNVVADASRDDFLVPGSVLAIESDPGHPLAWGMPERSFGYFVGSPAFGLAEGFRGQTTSVAVRYPNADLLASGWARGAARIAGRAAAVEVDLGPASNGGRIVLLGLRPQHRAQTHATFKLLLNAVMAPRGPEARAAAR